MRFRDREHAGFLLGQALIGMDIPAPLVLAIPRGGVVVGAAVARALESPLDIIVPRKIGAPGNPELAVGAITPDGEPILNQALLAELRVGKEYLERTVDVERAEAARRERVYREGRPPLDRDGRSVIVVDDGLATGATAEAALRSVAASAASAVYLAIPVAPKETVEQIRVRGDAEEVVVLDTPSFFYAVGQFYDDFRQTTDEEVIELLRSAEGRRIGEG